MGFEWAGIETKWQVEIEPFCQRVLAKHWPNVKRYGDIRECGKHNLEAVDIISGGFPCQDISQAGERIGIDGERSGLWGQMYRILRELRPKFAVVENVAALLDRGMERVLWDLAEGGFDAEWSVLSACQFGAAHTRERVFIVAYPTRNGLEGAWKRGAHGEGMDAWDSSAEAIAQMRLHFPATPPTSAMGVAYGFPHWMDRISGLGNAVVPQITEWIGRRIIENTETHRTN